MQFRFNQFWRADDCKAGVVGTGVDRDTAELCSFIDPIRQKTLDQIDFHLCLDGDHRDGCGVYKDFSESVLIPRLIIKLNYFS